MLTDILLINNIKENGDQNSFNELVNRHTGLYNTIAYHYTKTGDAILYHDMMDDREYNFLSFIKDYDQNKGMKFSTYLGDRTKYLCMDRAKSYYRYTFEEVDDNMEFSIKPDIELFNKDMVLKLKEEIEKIDNVRFKKIMKMRYFSERGEIMTFSEIAKTMNVSIQYVNKVYQDNIPQFLEDFKKSANI